MGPGPAPMNGPRFNQFIVSPKVRVIDENGENLIRALNAQDDSDIHILGVFDDRNDSRALETCAGQPKLGKIDDIVEFAQQILLESKLRLQIEQLFEQLFRVRFLAHSLTVDAFERVPIKTDRMTT